jgi:transposase
MGQTIIDETDDDRFLEFYRSIPTAKREAQYSLHDYIPKAFGEKRTYPQDWPAYDKAKTNEDYMFKELLRELLLMADIEQERSGPGRKGYSVQDKIFCAAIKVYARSSLRKAQSMLKELKRLKYIDKVPCFKSIDNFIADKSIPPILDQLIHLSTLPLLQFEKVAAVDASGFSVSKYEQWSAYKWGNHSKSPANNVHKQRIWRKAHIVCGCKTNIILSAKVTRKDVADTRLFPMLSKNARAYYDIKEITADMAYNSRDNFELAAQLGMIPFIPFKKNTRGKQKGCRVWGVMFRHFRDHNEEFMRHYHQRSNVESVFHVLKQRFGNNLTTKSLQSNGCEIKLKALCHNLVVLIQEFFESGAEIDFSECVKIMQSTKKTWQ